MPSSESAHFAKNAINLTTKFVNNNQMALWKKLNSQRAYNDENTTLSEVGRKLP